MKKVFLIIVGIFIIVIYAGNKYNDYIDEKYGVEKQKEDLKLNTKLLFNGTLLTITNNDIFDYSNVKLKLNDDYELNTGTIQSGKSIAVSRLDFSNSKSERFTYDKKPKELLLSCTVSGEIALAKWKLEK